MITIFIEDEIKQVIRACFAGFLKAIPIIKKTDKSEITWHKPLAMSSNPNNPLEDTVRFKSVINQVETIVPIGEIEYIVLMNSQNEKVEEWTTRPNTTG